LREVIRDEYKVKLVYRDEKEQQTERTIRPLVLSYRSTCVLLAAWCELRNGFRHFRTDRIYGCEKMDQRFVGQGDTLRSLWHDQYPPMEHGL